MWHPRIQLLASLAVTLACLPPLVAACSGTTESSSQQSGAEGGQAGSASCPTPQGMGDCWNPCTQQMYAPTCEKGAWTCAGPDNPAQCPDAGDAGDGDEVACPPPPGPMDCWDPCTSQMYGPSCVNGAWTCAGPDDPSDCPDAGQDAPSDVKPDCPLVEVDCWGCSQVKIVDGCVVGCEWLQGCISCGTKGLKCLGDESLCVTPMPPGNCPDPGSGQCPPGCPGCPEPEPSCAAIPDACKAAPTCDCILEEYCPVPMGDCTPENGGFRVQCTGAP